MRGKQPRVARKISHTPCLFNNLELDYEIMEKAEIKFMDLAIPNGIDDYLKDLEEIDD